MAIDYPVRRSTRRCAATGDDLEPGVAVVSALVDEGNDLVRRDYLASAWAEPPDGAIGWWRWRTPPSGDATPAPRDVLLGLLDEWADQPGQAAARYLLALLLVRRRVLRPQEDSFLDGLRGESADAQASLRLSCPDRDEPIEVAIVHPTRVESESIQNRLIQLLGAA